MKFANYVFALTLISAQVAMAATIPDSPDNVISPTFVVPATAGVIVLLPAQSTSSYREQGDPLLMQQVSAQLSAAGYQLISLPIAKYREIWLTEVAAVGGIFDTNSGQLRPVAYSKALSALVKRVAGENKAVMVIRPALVDKFAEMDHSKGIWDGQQWFEKITGSLVPAVFGAEFNTSGHTSALSAELIAFNGDGSFAFKTYGGTSLVMQIDVDWSVSKVRPDLFKSDAETADGVRIALRPLLGNKLGNELGKLK